MAVSFDVYQTFFQLEFPQNAVQRYQVLLIVYEPISDGYCAMDTLNHYRDRVQTLLSRYASEDPCEDDVKIQLIFDTERDHYQWMNVGWHQLNRIYRCIVHIDIKDGKIWLQQNLTDQNPAEDLVKMGVAKEDIILGLHPPYKRPCTDYGVA